MDELDLEKLDPGIRRVVKLLRSRGWQTTDSGDGVTKFQDPHWDGAHDQLCDVPHVVISPATSHNWANIVEQDLRPFITDEAAERLSVEFSYSSKSKIGILIVLGVSDADLL